MMLQHSQTMRRAVSCGPSRLCLAPIVPAARSCKRQHRDLVAHAEEPSTSQAEVPPTAEAREELPPWVRSERMRELQAQTGSKDLPWPLYLLFSTFVAIAAVGSIFEYANKHALFDVIQPDSPLWAPILGLFAITGLPTSGFLFFKGVNAANEAFEAQDKVDGYID